MLKDRATEYYEKGYNCAETILRAANDEYQLGLTEDAMKLCGGFGAGMGCGKACGALCGGICAISAKLIETSAHETPELRAACTKLVAAFNRILGDTECKNLMQKYKKPDTRCLQTVLLGCEALESVME
ncbi:MAG TPA: C-GCAxxG-C-C family protein [Candidatus Butyricicoccus stercorigallinarum]|nr:C-GCAxxG-C-C family protein [Candidatus Butyricicoccus stercorigallinarum]